MSLHLWRAPLALLIATSALGCVQHAPKPFERNAVPAIQSNCEIEANKFRTAHPDMDMFDKRNRFPMPFYEAGPPEKPFSYQDAESGLTFYVESDGRHLVAIEPGGKLRWVRNPFVDSDMCPYRSAHPYIYWVGPSDGDFGYKSAEPAPPRDPKFSGANLDAWIVKNLNDQRLQGRHIPAVPAGARFIGLRFNSSNFGYVNIANGDYFDQGQN